MFKFLAPQYQSRKRWPLLLDFFNMDPSHQIARMWNLLCQPLGSSASLLMRYVRRYESLVEISTLSLAIVQRHRQCYSVLEAWKKNWSFIRRRYGGVSAMGVLEKFPWIFSHGRRKAVASSGVYNIHIWSQGITTSYFCMYWSLICLISMSPSCFKSRTSSTYQSLVSDKYQNI